MKNLARSAVALGLSIALAACAAEKPIAPRADGAPHFGPDGKEAKLVVNWEQSALPQRDWAPWLAYLLGRIEYRSKKNIAETYYGPQPAGFEEEVWARDTAAQVYVELRQKDRDLDVPYFDDLVRVRAAGFLREYVWIYLNRSGWRDPGGLRIKEFEAWQRVNLAGHRAVTYGTISLERQ
jgi:hypothetical protein